MAILRYTASADTIITNGFNYTLSTRGTGSNMGYADSLEVYSIYGETSSSTDGPSQELARTLIKFPTSTISANRTAGKIPASGAVSFYLRMYNVETGLTLPQNFTLDIKGASGSWTEGTGLDMEEYTDKGAANWTDRRSGSAWVNVGGDFYTTPIFSALFPQGYEDLEIDVTPLVEQWIASSSPRINDGFLIKLTGSEEAYTKAAAANGVIANTTGSKDTYYTKRFSARSTSYFFNRPVLEARWDSRTSDNRGDFYYSSSAIPASENINTIYFYNYVRGRLVNIPDVGTGKVRVSLYSGSTSPTGSKLLLPIGGGVVAAGDINVTGGWASRGVYSASFALTGAASNPSGTAPLSQIFDVWHSGSLQYFTGTVAPTPLPTYNNAPTFVLNTACRNLRTTYANNEIARFRFFIRNKDWSPTIYTVATANNPTDIIASASYKVFRVTDDLDVIGYGTGSDKSTYLSYDVSGNYFDLDMSMLEKDYMYGIKLVYYNDSVGAWVEQPQTFKFRVEEY